MSISPALLPNNKKPYRYKVTDSEVNLPRGAVFDKIINIAIHRNGKPDIVIRSDYDLDVETKNHFNPKWTIRRCSQKPSIQIKFKVLTQSLASQIDLYIHNFFIFTGEGNMSLYDFMDADNQVSYPITGIDIIMGYAAQFPKPRNPKEYLTIDASNPPNGTTGLRIREITYSTYDKAPPNSVFHIHGYITGQKRIAIKEPNPIKPKEAPKPKPKPTPVPPDTETVVPTESPIAEKEIEIPLLKPEEANLISFKLDSAESIFYNLIERRFIRDTFEWLKEKSEIEAAAIAEENDELERQLAPFKEVVKDNSALAVSNAIAAAELKEAKNLINELSKFPLIVGEEFYAFKNAKNARTIQEPERVPTTLEDKIQPNAVLAKKYIASDGYLNEVGAKKFGCEVIIPKASKLNNYFYQYYVTGDKGKLKSIEPKEYVTSATTIPATFDYLREKFFPGLKYIQLVNGNYLAWLASDFEVDEGSKEKNDKKIAKIKASFCKAISTQPSVPKVAIPKIPKAPKEPPVEKPVEPIKIIEPVTSDLYTQVKVKSWNAITKTTEIISLPIATIPAVYNISVSAGTSNISCPYFNIMNPGQIVKFNSRYNLTDSARYYSRGKANQVYFSIIDYTVDFSTTGKENVMTLFTSNATLDVVE